MTLIMVQTFYLVKEEFDPDKDYGIEIRKQFGKCLSVLKKGERINLNEFVQSHLNQFTSMEQSLKSNRTLIYHSFTIGKKIGMLETLSQEESGMSISMDNFRKLESISYLMLQLGGSKYKNLKTTKDRGTAISYAYKLWKFNEWLHGKTFEFQTSEQQGKETFLRIKKQITLTGLEHFLKLYQDPYKTEQEFVKIIKQYLMDSIHTGKRAVTMKIDYAAIKSYFEKNEYPLNVRIDLKNLYKTTEGDDDQPSLDLEEVMKLLTVGKPSITQKAVFLCKLHRGLDNSTFADRFNFQVWDQLVSYFGTDEYTKWDLKRCPVPIKLTRMKTGILHVGFLDKDAVTAIQEYLDFRRKKTGNEMKSGALFLSEKNEPITEMWIITSFSRLRKNAGLDKTLGGYERQRKYRATPHELRDLLKSTLIDSGTRPDLADYFIGHKPKDSYEKQAILYPETLRKEYSKASKMLNIFSNFSSHMKSAQSGDEMKERMSKIEEELAKALKRIKRTDKLKRK